MSRDLRAGKTYRLNWEEWKEFCAEQDIDPHENCEHGFDLGGGDSFEIVCYEDPPKEEILEDLESKLREEISKAYKLPKRFLEPKKEE